MEKKKARPISPEKTDYYESGNIKILVREVFKQDGEKTLEMLLEKIILDSVKERMRSPPE